MEGAANGRPEVTMRRVVEKLVSNRTVAVTPWHDLEITADGTIVAELEASRQRSGSVLAEIDRWKIDDLLKRAVTPGEPATFDEMMPLWVGNSALRAVTEERKEQYARFLAQYGLADRFNSIIQAIAADRGAILECDLGPVHDFVLIEKYFELVPESPAPLVILEVGGGYGRLAEIFIRYASRPVCYVMADGIPESIYYSWAYLRSRLPHARIATHFSGEAFDPDRQDAYIVPAWVLSEIVDHTVDIAVNVASVQEMPDDTVAGYFTLFERMLRLSGLFFFENSREFFYKREYEYPDEWLYLIKRRSPRSRTLDYPVDLLQVTSSDRSAQNKIVIEQYYRKLKNHALRQLKEQNDTLLAQRREMTTLRRDKAAQIRELRDRHVETVCTLRERIAHLQERVRAQRQELDGWRSSSAGREGNK